MPIVRIVTDWRLNVECTALQGAVQGFRRGNLDRHALHQRGSAVGAVDLVFLVMTDDVGAEGKLPLAPTNDARAAGIDGDHQLYVRDIEYVCTILFDEIPLPLQQ